MTTTSTGEKMASSRWRLLLAINVVSLSLSLSNFGCADDAGSVELEQKRGDITNGSTVYADTVGTPALNWSDPPHSGKCSSTLIRQDWALTAHHCVTHNSMATGGTALPLSAVNAQIKNGANDPTAKLIVRHPTLDVALVKLNAAPTGSGGRTYPNWISLVSNTSFVSGENLYSQGWGALSITACEYPIPTTGMGFLRSGFFPFGQNLTGASYGTFTVVNTAGPQQQMPAPGDSGSGIFTTVQGYNRPIGVLAEGSCSGPPQNNQPLEMTTGDYTRSDTIRGWLQGVVGWGPRVGGAEGYERADGVNVANYIDSSGNVKELSNSGSGWNLLANLTSATGATPANPNTNLSSYVRTDGVNAVVYRGNDGKIWELSAGAQWWAYDMTDDLGLPDAASDPATYVRSDDTSVVTYVGVDNNVWQMSLPSGGTQWSWANLTAAAGAPPASQWAIGYVRTDGLNAVVYTDVYGFVEELELNGSGSNQYWGYSNLTNLTGAPQAVGQARPYTREDGYSAVVFRASTGHLWEMSLYYQAPQWYAGDMTADGSNCPPAASDPSPFIRADNWESVLFLDSYGNAYEESLPPGSGWRCTNLTATAVGGPPYSTTVPDGFVGSDRSTNVILTGPGGHIWDLTLAAAGTESWNALDLTNTVGGGP